MVLTVTMTTKLKTGLACMRLQPFHKGHQRLIDLMLSECETCYLIIGSAQEKETENNPISYINRKRLVENYYTEEWVNEKLIILGAEDINDFPNWSKYLVNLIPNIVEKYYAGTESDASAFNLYPPSNYPKIKVEVLDRNIEPKLASATKIRELFRKGNPSWKLHIPKDNVKITQRVLNGEHPFPELEKLEKEMGGELL